MTQQPNCPPLADQENNHPTSITTTTQPVTTTTTTNSPTVIRQHRILSRFPFARFKKEPHSSSINITTNNTGSISPNNPNCNTNCNWNTKMGNKQSSFCSDGIEEEKPGAFFVAAETAVVTKMTDDAEKNVSCDDSNSINSSSVGSFSSKQQQRQLQRQRHGHHYHSSSLKSMGSSVVKSPARVAHFVASMASKIGTAVERIIFIDDTPPSPPPRIVRGGVLLYGCDTPEEHFQQHDAILGVLEELKLTGKDGLQAAGLELRHVPCPVHANASANATATVMTETNKAMTTTTTTATTTEKSLVSLVDVNDDIPPNKTRDISDDDDEDLPEHDDSSVSDASNVGEATPNTTTTMQLDESLHEQQQQQQQAESLDEQHHCDDCCTRLVHRQSNTVVDHLNRKQFICDGAMYDEISRLCMECAQEIMIEQGDMKWVEIDHDDKKGPLCALVSSTHPAAVTAAANGSSSHTHTLDTCDMSKPTLLVVTGKGKVRAGIFSRQHILTTGMEPSTALFIVQEAKRRNMNLVLLDPNAWGEREAFGVVQKSMAKLFSYMEEPETPAVLDTGMAEDANDSDLKGNAWNATTTNSACQYPLFIEAHSAAGSHVVRYLMERHESFLPHVRAIAFTDSTHSIQWAKNIPTLSNFLESSAAVYFRSSNANHDGMEECKSHHAGLEIKHKDSMWLRRFGTIRTCWAGTTEHSLSDFSARKHVWQHFDQYLSS